jgi:hypothetical protein
MTVGRHALGAHPPDQARLRYAAAKFSEAAYALVAGHGEIKARLREAYRCVGPVSRGDVPHSLRARVSDLLGSRGRVLSTRGLRAMRIREASSLELEFYDVCCLLAEGRNRASPASSSDP